MKTIIYYRKSTDRDDRQANSLEHQLANCLMVSKKYDLEVVEKIGESRSAKSEGTRAGFNRMVDMCKKGNIDYIIIDEPKRLSRNNIDTSRIIDLMDKNLIKGILGSGREYRSDNSRDKFLLQLDLSLSKMDNEDRSKDVKDKMKSCVNTQKRFLGKAPFGYRNITIKKGHKDIIVDEREAEIVREIFELRVQNKAFSTIGNILKDKYGKSLRMTYEPPRIQKLVSKKFYYGVFIWAGNEILGSHKPIISKELYDKVNKVGKGVHEQYHTLKQEPRKHQLYHLKGFVRDVEGYMLTCCNKKNQVYYMNQPRSSEKININENIIFDRFGEILKDYDTQHKLLTEVDKEIILGLIREQAGESVVTKDSIESDILKLRAKQDRLLDMSLEGKIPESTYTDKNNELENQIFILRDQINNLKDDDLEQKTQMLFELAGSLYSSYNSGSKDTKAQIIKLLLFELSITHKKELRIQESPIFKSSKMLNMSFGIPTENGTPVSALRRPHPNH